MESKIITRTDKDTADYSLVRKKMQTINFAKFQEILQRNVAKVPNQTFTQYTRELLDQYIQSPLNNLDNLREISRFLTRVSMIYKQMISYFSTMPLYNYNITPIVDYSSSVNQDKVMKSYMTVLNRISKFNMFKELSNVVSNTIRDGMYVGVMYDSEKDGMFLMPLDIKYCRIYGKTPEGEWIVYFDAAYFDKGDNKNYIYGVNNDGIGVWRQDFIEGYENYKANGREYEWFRLIPEQTLCMIASTDDEFNLPLPYFLPIFKSLLQLLDTENLVAAKTEIENYKLILNKIPLLKNSENVDDFSVSLEIIMQFQKILEAIVPENIGIGITPCDTSVVDFEKSTSAKDTDNLGNAMKNLFANAGINKLIVASGDSSNANGIKYSIANDLGKLSIYLRRIESWLNYYIKHNIAEGFQLEIFNQTQYNRGDFINEKKEAASLGGPKLDYLCALGQTPFVAYNKLRFDSEMLDIQQYMIPLSSTYTQTGNAAQGRPTKNDDDISEEGERSRDKASIKDRGV